MSLSPQTEVSDYLADSLEQNKKARDDAREYHKLRTGERRTFKFIIQDKATDILVERKNDEEDGKPYSVTTFKNVVDLDSEVQEPKPLRTSSKRLLEKLNEKFGEGAFTLQITKFGEQFDTDYKVVAVN